MRLSDHPAAEAELVESAEFYESRSPGLGGRFLREFDKAIEAIQNAPNLWPVVEADLRCHSLRKFPFAIYYRVQEDELRILVVQHHRRHPDFWRDRLDN